ncbi:MULTISPECIES: hypothetical protein [Pseudomonas]|uniref:hypothetical protein n=1 Tax=Pseudomonas TaxID=286 RepID=UPI0012E0FCE1|nr:MULTISPECIES: hypothetical protein [Pseudomonas]MBH3472054.1 hypothetical protein [Pseudomonas putida]
MKMWEPVSGVFWSTSPAPVVTPEVATPLPLSTAIYCGLLLAVIIPLTIRHISTMIRPEGLDLRKHLGLIGFILTLVYFAVIFPLIWGRIGTLGTMPLNEVGDFLAGAFGPVAFFWVVLGFVQQGEELRMQALDTKNAEIREEIMAKIAMEQAEAQRVAMEEARKRREREISAKFLVSTGSSGNGRRAGEAMNEIRIRNKGNKALNVEVSFGEPFLDPHSIVLGEIGADGEASQNVYLPLTQGPVEGKLILRYNDVDESPRVESFKYRVVNSRTEFND